MNTKILPLAAATVFALCAGSMLLSRGEQATAAPLAIVDLPSVQVRPAAEDLAYYQAHKIVDLAAVQVRPDAADLAYYQAQQAAPAIVDLATVNVRPAAADLAYYLASRAARVVTLPTLHVHPDVSDLPLVLDTASLAQR